MIIALLLFVGLACNLGTPDGVSSGISGTQTAAVAQTLAAGQTVSAGQTAAARTASPTRPATMPPPPPTATQAPSATQPSPTPLCQDKVGPIKDVTYPDGDQVQAGKSFVKTWRIKNTGTCTWSPKYTLVFFDKEQMGAASPIPINNSVPPDGEVELSVQLKAPTQPGSYRGEWLLHNASDKPFGWGATASEPFWVEITVVGEGTPISTATQGLNEIALTLKVDQPGYSGSCPARLNFTAQVQTNGPGTVELIFEAGTNSGYYFPMPGATTRTLTKAGTLTLPYFLNIESSMEGWAVLRVTSPIPANSTPLYFSVTCQ